MRTSLIEDMFEVRAECIEVISKMEGFLTSSMLMKLWNSSDVEDMMKEVKQLKAKVGTVNLTAAVMNGSHDRFQLGEVTAVAQRYRELTEE